MADPILNMLIFAVTAFLVARFFRKDGRGSPANARKALPLCDTCDFSSGVICANVLHMGV